jgi:hypothetical protein
MRLMMKMMMDDEDDDEDDENNEDDDDAADEDNNDDEYDDNDDEDDEDDEDEDEIDEPNLLISLSFYGFEPNTLIFHWFCFNHVQVGGGLFHRFRSGRPGNRARHRLWFFLIY